MANPVRAAAGTPASSAVSAGLVPLITPTRSDRGSASVPTGGRGDSVTATLCVGITSTVKSTSRRRSSVSKMATIRSPWRSVEGAMKLQCGTSSTALISRLRALASSHTAALAERSSVAATVRKAPSRSPGQ